MFLLLLRGRNIFSTQFAFGSLPYAFGLFSPSAHFCVINDVCGEGEGERIPISIRIV